MTINHLVTLSVAVLLLTSGCANNTEETTIENAPAQLTADPDNGSITLPDGFSAYVVADDLGKTRHIAVNDNGDIYAKLSNTKQGGGIVALRDTTGDGRPDIKEYFTDYGGSGIALYENYLYFTTDTSVYRVPLPEGELVPSGEPELVVGGFLSQPQHAAKPITFDNDGHMYVTVGGPSNACQEQMRTPGSPGVDPCPQLERQGGIWRFSATELNQTQEANGERYATGIRNGFAIDWNNNVNGLYALQHGRDQLGNLWPEYYNEEQSAELPAEEFLKVNEGDDFWLALLLLRSCSAREAVGARVRRKRRRSRTLCGQKAAHHGFPRALGSQRSDILPRQLISRSIPKRSLYRLSRLLEPRSPASARLLDCFRTLRFRRFA